MQRAAERGGICTHGEKSWVVELVPTLWRGLLTAPQAMSRSYDRVEQGANARRDAHRQRTPEGDPYGAGTAIRRLATGSRPSR